MHRSSAQETNLIHSPIGAINCDSLHRYYRAWNNQVHSAHKILPCVQPSMNLTSLIDSNSPENRISAQHPPHLQAITFCALRAEKPLGFLAKLSLLPFTQAKVKVKRRQQRGGLCKPWCYSRDFWGVCTATSHCKSWQAKNGWVTNLEMKLWAVCLLLY